MSWPIQYHYAAVFFCRKSPPYWPAVFTPSTRSQYETVLACCFDLGNTGLLCCLFFLLYFPWTLRQCSDCCIVLLYCPSQNGRVFIVWCICWCIGWYHRGFPWLGRRTTLLYWNTTRLYLYFEIKTWGHSPRVLLASKTHHPPRVLCSCGNPTPNTCGCDEQRERREGEHTQAQWHGAIWTWIIEGEYRFCCFAVFLGVFLVKSPLFWLENRQKICCCIVSVLSQITAVFSANTAGFTAE